MKVLPLVAAAAAVLAFTTANAAPDAAGAEKMLKADGCTKCHAVDKAKKGPAFKKVAADFKGKPDAEAKLTTFLTTGPKIAGSEDTHKSLAGKDPASIKNLVQWILAQ